MRPMQQVVGRLVDQDHTEFLLQEASDVAVPRRTDPILGSRPGLEKLVEPLQFHACQAGWASGVGPFVAGRGAPPVLGDLLDGTAIIRLIIRMTIGTHGVKSSVSKND